MYTVLAIEDNPADALLLREAFREAGNSCALEIVSTPAEARHLLATHWFDLIVCQMGREPGGCANAIRTIRENDHLKLVPVIVLSASPNVNDAYQAGAAAFIPKTADLNRFFSNIKVLLNFWLDAAILPQKPGRAASA
jgi:chemotaxis family two-component system response regulator Rcp1